MLIEILKAVLFGIVEGITEWLPISSTGHMILVDQFVHLNVSADFYKIIDIVRSKNIPLRYFTSASATKGAEQVVAADNGK